METYAKLYRNRHKRARSSSENELSKFRKYNGFIPFMKEFSFSENSKEEFETLIALNFDVDYYDPAESDCTPLCYAVQNELHSWTKLLLENGAAPDSAFMEYEDGSKYMASEIAWSQGNYNIVFELVLADGPYPQDFASDKFNMLQLLKMKTLYLDLHKQIKGNFLENVKIYVEKNPKIKHAYDFGNKTALTIALECKNFKIYSFLRSRGFACGVDDGHDNLLKKLRKRDKKALNNEIQKYFKCADFHILNLLSNSRLGMNNDKALFSKLTEYFEKLDQIEEIHPILKIIACEKNFSIIFDFNESHIGNLDPAECPINSKYVVRGRTYKERKNILIAAKQRSESELLGILAQELTHFALLKVYGNDFLPYKADDLERETKFSKVVDVCHCLKDKEEIIDAVFEYEETETKVELIARVPQLLAQNNSEELLKNRETFDELFRFYTNYVLNDIVNEVSLIQPKQNVQELNRTFGVLHRLKTTEIRFQKPNAELHDILKCSNNVFIQSKLPQLVLSNIVEGFKLNDSEHIFVELEQLAIKSNLTLIVEMFVDAFKPAAFIIDSENVECEKAETILDQMKNGKIVFLSNRSLSKIEGKLDVHEKVEFKFADIISESKQKLLSSKVDFQGSKIELKNILGDDLDEVESWPLEDLLHAFKIECKINNFEALLPKTSEIFIPRTFQTFDSNEILGTEKVIAKLETDKTIIISDVAGMGKTTSAVNFARALKNMPKLVWIAFFDLKQHTEVLESLRNENNFESVKLDAALQEMIKIKSETEKKLFNFFFKNSSSVFVIDGFDEISPSYKEFVLSFMQLIQRFGNRLLVTTRTHLESELASKLGSESMPINIVKLLPFTKENQIEFLAKFWERKSKSSLEDLARKARHMLEEIRTSLINEQIFLEIPLQLFMLADITKSTPGSLHIDFKLFSLYEHFVRNKLKIFNAKGELALDDNTNIQMEEFNVLLFHQKVAIEAFYGKKVVDSLQFPKISKSLNEEVICRIGFLQISINGEYQFSHQTFGDFFVVQILMKSITTEIFMSNFNILQDLFVGVLVGSTHFDENIRNFINERLKANDEVFHREGISQKLEHNLSVELNSDFLIRLIEKNQNSLINFIFKKLNISKDMKMKIVKHKNIFNYNALHVATASFDSWKLLWSCIESFTTVNERKDILLIGGGFDDFSIFQMLQDSKEKDFHYVQIIYTKLFGDKKVFVNTNPDAYHAHEQKSSPLERFWNSIEDNFKPEHQKQLLFKNSDLGLFHDLLISPAGCQIALNAVKKLFNSEESKIIMMNIKWLKNNGEWHTLSLKNHTLILNFLQNFLYKGYEEKAFEVFFKHVEIRESLESEGDIEYSMFNKTLDALSILIEKSNFKKYNSIELFKCISRTLVLISTKQMVEFVSLIWNFVEENFDNQEQKKLLLLKYKSMNITIAVAQNSNKLTLKYVFEILNRKLECSDIRQAVHNTDDQWLFEALCEYASFSDCEGFRMFWSFVQGKLDKEDQKLIFRQVNRKENSAFIFAAQNKDKSTTELVINTARALFIPNDLEVAVKSNDQKWLHKTLCIYSAFTEFRVFELFWSFLQENLDKDDQKLILLRLDQNERNGLLSSAENKDKLTIAFIIKIVKSLFEPDDLTTFLKSSGKTLFIETLCEYAAFAELEIFALFWSFLQENLNQNDLKMMLLQNHRNGLNTLMHAAQNNDKSTIKRVIDIARSLFGTDDFTIAPKFKDQMWLCETLCGYTAFSKSEGFDMFWSFLQENLNKGDQKKILLQKKQNGKNALVYSAMNKDTSIIEMVVRIARGLFTRDDFAAALKCEDTNWIKETVSEFAALAESKVFAIFWSFVKDNTEKTDQKFLLLYEKSGLNTLVSAAKNKDISTLKYLINTASALLEHDHFTEALTSKNQMWLSETLCGFTSLAEPDALELYLSILREKFDNNDHKRILLQKNQKGFNALMGSSFNKEKATIMLTIRLYRGLFPESILRDSLFFVFWFNHLRENFDEFKIHFEPQEFNSFLQKNYFDRNLIYFLTVVDNVEDSSALWKKTLEHINPHEIKKQLLARDQYGNNSFNNAALNNRIILSDFFAWFKNSYNDSELKRIFKEKNDNLDSIMHIVAFKCNANLCQKIIDFVSSSLDITEIQRLLMEKNSKRETPFENSRRNVDPAVARLFSKFI